MTKPHTPDRARYPYFTNFRRKKLSPAGLATLEKALKARDEKGTRS